MVLDNYNDLTSGSCDWSLWLYMCHLQRCSECGASRSASEGPSSLPFGTASPLIAKLKSRDCRLHLEKLKTIREQLLEQTSNEGLLQDSQLMQTSQHMDSKDNLGVQGKSDKSWLCLCKQAPSLNIHWYAKEMLVLFWLVIQESKGINCLPEQEYIAFETRSSISS